MTGVAGTSQVEVYSEQQRTALAHLLAQHLTISSMQSLAAAVIHRDVSKEAPNEVGDKEAYAGKLVEILADAGALGSAVALVRSEGSRNGALLLGLTGILEPLDNDNLQNFEADFEPFIPAAVFEQMLPRVRRTICAIGLDIGAGARSIKGTGFLVGPDLVMTNYHVLDPFLKEEAGVVTENHSGDDIYCFFDYDAAPQPLIPPDAMIPNRIAQGVKEKWLVCAGPPLLGDGGEHPGPFTNQLDFAVIRLARPIGDLPARIGGGARRGWLTLEQQINVKNAPRLVLFQHPGQSPQRFDIGPLHKLDETESRVWYWINTAKGSSGGAAVDTSGRLFAIHNAEVTRAAEKQPGKFLNQGIRIDRIAAAAPNCIVPQPVPASSLFWSLSDDIKSPEPVIGRAVFRDYVAEMLKTSPSDPRVLVVTGEVGTGVRFSLPLLRRIVGTQTPIIEIKADELEKLTPKQFLSVLVNALDLRVATPMPDPKGTEDLPRWIREDLAPWFQSTLVQEEMRARSRFPAWIAMNTLVPGGNRLLWAENLRDLVGLLVGVRDPGQPGIAIPQLRWVFLARTADALSLPGIERRYEDLTMEKDHATGFTSCLQSAWFALDRNAAEIPEKFLKTLAADLISLSPNLPPRMVLAARVRGMVELLLQQGSDR
jgi:hypothetical protein